MRKIEEELKRMGENNAQLSEQLRSQQLINTETNNVLDKERGQYLIHSQEH